MESFGSAIQFGCIWVDAKRDDEENNYRRGRKCDFTATWDSCAKE